MTKLVHNCLAGFLLFCSLSGKAQSYFQQEVNTQIDVTLHDSTNELTAQESIEYINNSPQTLQFIYMHLWPNAYKDNTTALAKQLLENGNTILYHAKESDKGFIDGLDFKLNGVAAKWEYLKDSIDICKLYLNEPLAPGAKVIITTPFHVKIPSGSISRLGHIGQSYQITQWYPKPAVYDNNGWNYIPYLNQGEFYSEFGSFDVRITLPENYVVGATGDLVDGEKELAWLDKKVEETKAISSFDKNDMDFPASSSATKTLRYKQSNVHDFAWFCDKRYHVLKGEVELPHTQHKVTTWVMFTNNEADLWTKSISYVNDALYYYSMWNGDYPYNQYTAVDGTISAGEGMEYPNITVIGKAGSAFLLDVVITHEAGHSWFYGMLGSNERMHAWMDEGINSFNENRYVETKYPDAKLVGNFSRSPLAKTFDLTRYQHKAQYELAYLLTARKNEDQPIELPAYDYTEINYGADVYMKSAIVFDYLMAYLGENEMDKAMQEYFNKWHFKHPQPKDLREVLETSTGKNLSWFFDDLIKTTKKLDYKIMFSKHNPDGSWDLGIKNTGEINGPVFIQGIKDHKLVGEIMYEGFPGKQILNFPASEVDYFQIDFTEDMPEINRDNDIIRTKGLFKKVEPIKLQFLGSLDNPTRSQLFYTPVAGWNNYNKWMLGMAFYNNLLPRKHFEFELMPMYSYSTNDFAGYGHLNYSVYPKGPILQELAFGFTGTRYAFENAPFDMNFSKLAPEINFVFKKKYPRSPVTHRLRYRHITLLEDSYEANYAFDPTIYSRAYTQRNFNDLNFSVSRYDAINPFSVSLQFLNGEHINKLSFTGNYSYNFKKKNKGIDVRLFAGTFLGTNASDAGSYRFQMSGWRGYQDYLYDHVYLGRSESSGLLSNQFTESEGGFKFFSYLGQSAQWLAALNIKSSLGNLKLPVGLFADVGTCGNDGLLNDQALYDAGVYLSLRKNIFEIYFPLIWSKDMENYKSVNGISYAETIRFTLNLDLINPFKIMRTFSL